MNLTRLSSIAVVMSFLCGALHAQTVQPQQQVPTQAQAVSGIGSVAGSVRTKDGFGRRGVSGATVVLIAGRDTMMSTTLNGLFGFRKVRAGEATLKVSFIGYKTEEVKITVTANRQAFQTVELSEEATQIDDVVVTAQVPAMSQKGDTLIYNAAAVKTLTGDVAEDVLKQMPGVEVGGDGVTVLGRSVDRVYVDGKLIFGEGRLTALHNLLANDVVKIKTYEETTEESLRSGRKQDDKRMVMDIQTRSKIISQTSGYLLGSYGYNYNRNDQGKLQPRYGGGLTLDYFSEKLRMSFNSYLNNVNRSSNRMRDILNITNPGGNSYNRIGGVDLSFEKRWSVTLKPQDSLLMGRRFEKRLSGGYSFGTDYTKSASISMRNYFPSDKYQMRTTDDTTRNINQKDSHNINWRFNNNYSGFTVSQSVNIWTSTTDIYSGVKNILDDAIVGRTSLQTDNGSNGYTIAQSVNWRNRKNFSVSASFDFAENDGNGWKVDTTATTTHRMYLNNTEDGYSRNFSLDAGKSFNLINNDLRGLYFRVSYGFDYQNENSKRIGIDQFTMELDSLNSSDYQLAYTMNSANASLSYNVRDKVSFYISTRLRSSRRDREEELPEEFKYDNSFNSVLPSLSLRLGPQIGNSFSLNFSSSTQLPSAGQLREQLNVSNPLSLSVGNPGLNQSYTYNSSMSYNIMNTVRGTTSRISVGYSQQRDGIVNRTYFFADTTDLRTIDPHWDYIAVKGSTLTTYENMRYGDQSANINLSHNRFIQFIKSKFDVAAGFNYGKSNAYLNNKSNNNMLNVSENYSGNLYMGFNGTLTRRFSYSISGNGTYRFTHNSEGDDTKAVNQSYSANTRWDATDWFYLNVNYRYTKYHSYTAQGKDNEAQVLNVAAGFKAFKRLADITLTAYDLMNNDSNFSSTTKNNHILNTWRQSFGRYFLVNLAYRINATRSQSGRSFGLGGPDSLRGGPGGDPRGSSSGGYGGGQGGYGGGGGRPR